MLTETQLDAMLSEPSAALVKDLARLEGDIMILGAGGKVGPTLSRMAARAVQAAGHEKKVYAVSRFSDAEIAYCSLHDSVRLYRYMWNGMMQGKSIYEGNVQQGNKALNEKRIHPTQKPIALYKWLLTKYAKQGDKILDTHVGSASSLIACEDMGYEYLGFEIDENYYNAARKRLEDYTLQTRILNKK